ncbi:MAG TPA: hypothetical protein VF766_09135 [Pyrinomonadaceae bacterium]
MTAHVATSERFVRRTALREGEYRKNFHQIDRDVLVAVTSEEADRVTPLMSKIYLRLVSAPAEFWEREGVLYFAAGEDGGRPVKASKVLYKLLGVASATAHKALAWMHEQGIIGYFAGKNGAGIRVFLNRAAGSIGVRPREAGKKILPFGAGSNHASRGSTNEPAFNDSFAVLEVLDTDINPRAPKNGADRELLGKLRTDIHPASLPQPTQTTVTPKEPTAQTPLRIELVVDEIVSRLRRELEPSLQLTARKAAAQEHERTREWLENRGLPKAARVAQREAYDLLRKHGLLRGPARGASDTAPNAQTVQEARKLSAEEIGELAEACVAMFEVKGQAVEMTVAEMSVGGGGFLLSEDALRVRELAESMLHDDS